MSITVPGTAGAVGGLEACAVGRPVGDLVGFGEALGVGFCVGFAVGDGECVEAGDGGGVVGFGDGVGQTISGWHGAATARMPAP